MAGDAKADWVSRVLGFAIAEAPALGAAVLETSALDRQARDRQLWTRQPWEVPVAGAAYPAKPLDEAVFRRSFRDAVAGWQSANQEVDVQINELRRVLLATDDRSLHRIAEFGLNGITGTRKVGLQKSLIELGGASGPALLPLARKARQAAEDFQGFVQSDVRIKACDAYPKITTPIGSTLGRALGVLAEALAI